MKDERILGSSKFVQEMLAQAQNMVKHQITPVNTAKKGNRVLEKNVQRPRGHKSAAAIRKQAAFASTATEKTRMSICHGIWLVIGGNNTPVRRINISGSAHAGTE